MQRLLLASWKSRKRKETTLTYSAPSVATIRAQDAPHGQRSSGRKNAEMSRSSIAIWTLCAALAACYPAKPLASVPGELSCPGYISSAAAIGIAKEFARQQEIDIAGHEIEVIWNDAEWSIFASLPDARYAMVSVSPDGRVTRCTGYHACSATAVETAARCKGAGGATVSGETAVRIASGYLSNRNIPHDVAGEHALWVAAHWHVWFVPQDPAPVDSDFAIMVSPDGFEMEMVPALGIPSRDSFLYRGPW